MSDALKDLEGAVENMKAVAKALHTPLDTTQVEKALKALVAQQNGSSPAPKPEVK